jgi:hypothetical protein
MLIDAQDRTSATETAGNTRTSTQICKPNATRIAQPMSYRQCVGIPKPFHPFHRLHRLAHPMRSHRNVEVIELHKTPHRNHLEFGRPVRDIRKLLP